MSQAIAVLALIAMTFLLQFLVMTQGWGVQVHSWGWLIGCIIAQCFVTAGMQAVKAEK